jgi:hypothetical protein
MVVAMHAPLHSLAFAHAGTQVRPSHVTDPPVPVGAWQGMQDVLSVGPQVASALLSTHFAPQT